MKQSGLVEFAIVAACCRWPPSQDRNDAINDAFASGRVDWPHLLKIARRHRVEPLVHDGLKASGLPPIPDVAAALAEASRRTVHQNLVFAAESSRLMMLLDSYRLPHLFVKGLTLAKLAYGTIAVKKAWDIDLLINEADIEPCFRILAEAGYVRSLPAPDVPREQLDAWVALNKEMVWRHQELGIVLELHWRLVDNPKVLPSLRADGPTSMVEIVPGLVLPTIDRASIFAYLAIHGASSGWSRLKWIADLNAFLRQVEVTELQSFWNSANDQGIARPCAVALVLCEQLFELPIPEKIRSEIKKQRLVKLLAFLSIGVMTRGSGTTEVQSGLVGTLPIHLHQFLIQKGMSFKLSELKRKSTSPTDVLEVRLPRHLRFLYPLLVIPLWIRRRLRSSS